MQNNKITKSVRPKSSKNRITNKGIGQGNQRPQSKMLNSSARDRLKDKLTEKFSIKFKCQKNKEQIQIINEEVGKFLQKNKLNENDLTNLEKNIKDKLTKYTSKQDLINNIKSNQSNKRATPVFDISEEGAGDCSAPPRNDSKHSQMSGGSDLDKFNDIVDECNKSK